MQCYFGCELTRSSIAVQNSFLVPTIYLSVLTSEMVVTQIVYWLSQFQFLVLIYSVTLETTTMQFSLHFVLVETAVFGEYFMSSTYVGMNSLSLPMDYYVLAIEVLFLPHHYYCGTR
ncbi:hypothetical protein EG68_12520 [Paragonimus skrjabini miyazakii]|uniref:Uncharacterized protein n=1 Tax=Paragonimus skrjabini miyazakii TaxID=59628 RepID=A0A8S9YBB7_9TREM|nr:hypothetical protein EG68_12520 [Paragonimus skrjabini miyazakii]